MQMPFQENAAAKENGSQSKVMSAEQAEDLKMKEKRKREREVLVILCAFCNLNAEILFDFLFILLIVELIIIEKSAEEEKKEVGGCSRAIRR